jgi:hypothetical protein
LSVLQNFGGDFFGKDFELEEVMTNFDNWKPA